MTRRTHCIDVLYPSDQQELFSLRSSAYKREYGADVDVSALKWNSWDERFINLGAFQGGELVSLLRLAHIKQPHEYERMMLCPVSYTDIQLPAMILCRAATRVDYERKGFHTLLRLHAFRLARASGVSWIASTFQSNSPRIPQMRDMGYNFKLNPNPWNDFLKSNGENLVATINLNIHFQRAEKRLLKSASSLLDAYPAVYSFESLIKRIHEA